MNNIPGFVYLNVNPDKQKESDCVTRAIKLATGLPYDEVRRKLYHTSKLLGCEKLCVCCYKFLIEEVFKLRRVNCDNMTVAEFSCINPYGIYLVRMNGHLSTIINGKVYDIFDCRSELLTDAWEVK